MSRFMKIIDLIQNIFVNTVLNMYLMFIIVSMYFNLTRGYNSMSGYKI